MNQKIVTSLSLSCLSVFTLDVDSLLDCFWHVSWSPRSQGHVLSLWGTFWIDCIVSLLTSRTKNIDDNEISLPSLVNIIVKTLHVFQGKKFIHFSLQSRLIFLKTFLFEDNNIVFVSFIPVVAMLGAPLSLLTMSFLFQSSSWGSYEFYDLG